jgi:hypothetical protein
MLPDVFPAVLSGVGADGEDTATLLSANWRTMRRLVLWKKKVPEFAFRQYLFASQVPGH